jgi:hypothetical protein
MASRVFIQHQAWDDGGFSSFQGLCLSHGAVSPRELYITKRLGKKFIFGVNITSLYKKYKDTF